MPDSIGDWKLGDAVGTDLFRVVDTHGRSGWLRLGPASTRARRDAWVNIDVEGLGPFEAVDDDEHVGLVWVGPEGIGLAELSRARLQPTMQRVASLIHKLHGQDVTLGAIDPDGIRVLDDEVHLIPVLAPAAPWAAPEGTGAPSADWYALGACLYTALTGDAELAWSGTSNGPDPRDRAPRSPELLSALAMDLLLLDPDERPVGPEIIEELVLPPDGPVEDVVDHALRQRGLAVLPERWRSRVLGLERSREIVQGSESLIRLVEKASALSKRARTRVVSLLTHPEALSDAQLSRASRLLGQALYVAGVRVAVWAEPDAVQQSVILEVLRAKPAPTVFVLAEQAPERLVDLCVASGIDVLGDPRRPDEALAGLPEHQLDSVLWDGRADQLAQQLLDLGVPHRSGLTGRALDRVADWMVPPRSGGRLQDASRARTAARLAGELAWVRPERAVLVARWARREALRAGDPESGALLHLVDAMLTGVVATDRDTGEHGEDVRLLGRALSLRHTGDVRAVVSLLDDQLPLVTLGPAENGAAGLLVAESLVSTGQWKRASLVLRSLRVDARRQGNRLLDLACTSLAACMGYRVRPEIEALLPEIEVGQGFLAWWVQRALALSELERPDVALERLRSCRVFAHWPMRLAGAPAVESRMLVQQLAWAAGEHTDELEVVHPLSSAWMAVREAVEARRRGDANEVVEALHEAAQRFEGAHAMMHAAAARRIAALWIGGPRGGTMVAAMDEVFRSQGCRDPASASRMLLPALGC